MFISTPALGQMESMFSPYQLYEDARLNGDLAAAAGHANDALDAAVGTFGSDSPEAVEALILLGRVQQEMGELAKAEQQFERALEISEQSLGKDHPDLVPLLESLAAINRQQREFDRAAQHLSALDDGPRRYSAEDGYAMVRVFYGTDRATTDSDKPASLYGGDRGELALGYLDVSIPETHKYGALETESRFSIYSYMLGEEAKKRRYILLQSVSPLPQSEFYSQLGGYIEGSPTNDVFLFVHGYNSSFEDAARRAAQLAYDLDFEGTPMMYSWPSRASTAAYTRDEAAVRPSGRKLARLLDNLVHETNADRIHLIAHSMGNRALIEALQAYVLKYGKEASRGVFDQIVFTAPDVDRDYFVEMMNEISGVARRTTLYASENDLALKSSRILHGASRAGLAGETIVRHPAVDTIDMSGIDADILGHTYFAVNEGAIYDLFRLFWRGDAPPQRCKMTRQGTDAGSFWQFDLDNCRGSDLLEAGLLYRKFGAEALPRLQNFVEKIDDDDAEKAEWRRILDRLHTLIEAP